MNLPLLIVTVCLQGQPCAVTVTAPFTQKTYPVMDGSKITFHTSYVSTCVGSKAQQEMLLSRVIKLPSTFKVECSPEFTGNFQPGGK